MPKITINFPEQSLFSTEISVMVSDLGAGQHVSNHMLLAYLTEAQMRFLSSMGYPDATIDGKITINSDTAVNYISEARYGDTLVIDIAIDNMEAKHFDFLFKVTKKNSAKQVLLGSMGMIFLDLKSHQVAELPKDFISACAKAGKSS